MVVVLGDVRQECVLDGHFLVEHEFDVVAPKDQVACLGVESIASEHNLHVGVHVGCGIMQKFQNGFVKPDIVGVVGSPKEAGQSALAFCKMLFPIWF